MKHCKQYVIQLKARKYLERVCDRVGALIGSPIWTGVARYQTAEYEFWVYSNSITRKEIATGKEQHTCVQHRQRMPEAEMVASLLLLLHDDPKHFESWRQQASGLTNAARSD